MLVFLELLGIFDVLYIFFLFQFLNENESWNNIRNILLYSWFVKRIYAE